MRIAGNVEIDQQLQQVLGEEGVARAAGRVHSTADCFTCGRPLGTKMVALIGHQAPTADGRASWLLTCHHKSCQPSRAVNNGIQIIPAAPTYRGVAFVMPTDREVADDKPAGGKPARRFRLLRHGSAAEPATPPRVERIRVPMILINPAVDLMEYRPERDGSVVDVGIERLQDDGWGILGQASFEMVPGARARTAVVSVDDDELVISYGPVIWSVPSEPRLHKAIKSSGGLAVLATHDVLVDDFVETGRPVVLLASKYPVAATWANYTT